MSLVAMYGFLGMLLVLVVSTWLAGPSEERWIVTISAALVGVLVLIGWWIGREDPEA